MENPGCWISLKHEALRGRESRSYLEVAGTTYIKVYITTWNPNEPRIFEGEPPKTRPNFQLKHRAPFGFQVNSIIPGLHCLAGKQSLSSGQGSC